MASTTSQTVPTPRSAALAANASSGLLLLAFAAVYILWGSTYFFIRVGVETMPPFVLAGLRHVIIGLVFYPVFRRLTGEKPTLAQWRTTAITGLLLLLCGNGGVSWAETRVPSGIAAHGAGSSGLFSRLCGHHASGGPRESRGGTRKPAGRAYIDSGIVCL